MKRLIKRNLVTLFLLSILLFLIIDSILVAAKGGSVGAMCGIAYCLCWVHNPEYDECDCSTWEEPRWIYCVAWCGCPEEIWPNYADHFCWDLNVCDRAK